MITPKDESESLVEYFSRVERLNEIQNSWIEDEEKVDKLRKFMSKADAIEIVYGEEERKSFESRRQDFIKNIEELKRKNRELSKSMDEQSKRKFEDIFLELTPKSLKEYYDVQ
jgi:uncharacterized protein YeeX (DUF496 family)